MPSPYLSSDLRLINARRQLKGYLAIVAVSIVLGFWYPLAVLIGLALIVLWFLMGLMMNFGSILALLEPYLTPKDRD